MVLNVEFDLMPKRNLYLIFAATCDESPGFYATH